MIRFMKTRGLLVVAAAATALVVGVACSSGEAAVTPAPDGSGAPAGEAVELAPASAVAGSELYAALQRAQSGVSQSGIWVTGEGYDRPGARPGAAEPWRRGHRRHGCGGSR